MRNNYMHAVLVVLLLGTTTTTSTTSSKRSLFVSFALFGVCGVQNRDNLPSLIQRFPNSSYKPYIVGSDN